VTFTVTTHLNFRGQARAALDFYGHVFGSQPVLMTYDSMGQSAIAMAADHIIWGQVVTDDGFRIMAFDVQAGRPYDPGNNAFFVSLRATSAEEIQARWSALCDGATVLQELAPSAWSPLYGMLTDRFGITWIVDVAPSGAP
jgi:PhnB protein